MFNYNNHNLFCFAVVCSFKVLTFELKMVERMSKNISVLLYDDLLIYIFESLPNNQVFANELVCKNGRDGLENYWPEKSILISVHQFILQEEILLIVVCIYINLIKN